MEPNIANGIAIEMYSNIIYCPNLYIYCLGLSEPFLDYYYIGFSLEFPSDACRCRTLPSNFPKIVPKF